MLINNRTSRVDVYIDETMKKIHFIVDVQKLNRFAHRTFFIQIFVKVCDSKMFFAINDSLDENVFELKNHELRNQIKKLKRKIETLKKTLKTKQKKLNEINARFKNAIMFSKLLSIN